jgi:hypothetical protein
LLSTTVRSQEARRRETTGSRNVFWWHVGRLAQSEPPLTTVSDIVFGISHFNPEIIH